MIPALQSLLQLPGVSSATAHWKAPVPESTTYAVSVVSSSAAPSRSDGLKPNVTVAFGKVPPAFADDKPPFPRCYRRPQVLLTPDLPLLACFEPSVRPAVKLSAPFDSFSVARADYFPDTVCIPDPNFVVLKVDLPVDAGNLEAKVSDADPSASPIWSVSALTITDVVAAETFAAEIVPSPVAFHGPRLVKGFPLRRVAEDAADLARAEERASMWRVAHLTGYFPLPV
eukprot:TRINITY_DN46453_c0_g1_i1.p1 TRINITY_DN46453_c0_g1~~TRINITY_DN46453_c0_g1_i1.p1  ORF type:complete len:228 (+),score=12.76 TRINITY_DN46453_c0_g1_i1:19-702(+)